MAFWCWVLALACFLLAAVGVSSRVNLLALGLFFLTLGMFPQRWP